MKARRFPVQSKRLWARGFLVLIPTEPTSGKSFSFPLLQSIQLKNAKSRTSVKPDATSMPSYLLGKQTGKKKM